MLKGGYYYMLTFRSKVLKWPDDFCHCEHSSAITSESDDEFGYWDVCCDCNKPLKDGYHYYEHYDGEDHDEIDLW
jgi:hypothetical protein